MCESKLEEEEGVVGMKLSHWHCEIAKRMAQGQANREIKREIQISDSRLSILKANPVFARKVDEYRKQEEDKYNKALKVFADEAESVAKEMVMDAKNPLVPPSTRHLAQKEILDTVARMTGNTGPKEDEMVFEQILRVTKKTTGQDSEPDEKEVDLRGAFKELEADFEVPDGEEMH